jgi:tight adherence protein C
MGSGIMIAGVGAAMLGAAVLLVVGMLASDRRGPTGVARSLALIEGAGGVTTSAHLSKNQRPARDRVVEPLLAKFRGLAERLSPDGSYARLHRLLDRAGNPKPWTAERVMGAKGLCLLVGAFVGFTMGGVAVKGLLFAVGMAGAMFFLPDLLLKNKAIKRREEAQKGLAEALDMLTVCVEAGQGFDAALHQVARNVEGPIAGEFARALSEVQIGRSRGEAFSGMGERIDTPEVKSFVTALVQADRLGLPIGQVLREQTATMRLARRQRAEEKAHKVAVKILFPLMFCILPAMFVVILGPGVIRLISTFKGL